MARVIAFSVEGLAGREDAYSKELQSDINVFFGVNGSGKTTLLKILHSAFTTDTSILKGLPFKRAEVTIHLNRYNKIFKRSFTQPDTLGQPQETQESIDNFVSLFSPSPKTEPS